MPSFPKNQKPQGYKKGGLLGGIAAGVAAGLMMNKLRGGDKADNTASLASYQNNSSVADPDEQKVSVASVPETPAAPVADDSGMLAPADTVASAPAASAKSIVKTAARNLAAKAAPKSAAPDVSSLGYGDEQAVSAASMMPPAAPVRRPVRPINAAGMSESNYASGFKSGFKDGGCIGRSFPKGKK